MSGQGVSPTKKQRDAAIRRAKDGGHTIVLADSKTLQLDLDSPEDLQIALNRIEDFRQHVGVERVELTRSKSGNYHLYVRLKKQMPRGDRLFWQCAFGSDWKREVLNWLWMQDGQSEECFLVEPGSATDELEGL